MAFRKTGIAVPIKAVTCKYCQNKPITMLNNEPVCADHIDEELAQNKKKNLSSEDKQKYLN